MRGRGREPDCEPPEAPGVGPMPHYAKGGRAKKKQVDGEGHKGHRRLDRGGRRSGGRLSYAERQKMPSGEFALPGAGTGPKGKGGGSYPIPDESHGRNALARVAQHGTPEEKAKVRAAVHRKFPDIGKE